MITAMDTQLLGAPVWFGPAEGPLRGWIHQPHGAEEPNSRHIVVVPGFGYEELTSGWGLRILAEELANAGHTVLRYDHPGTGDSSGDEPSLSAWLEGVHHAVSALKFPDVTIIGVRLGATIALAAAADSTDGRGSFANSAITQIIAVSPVVSGRRMVRELTMLAATRKAVSQNPVADYESIPLPFALPVGDGTAKEPNVAEKGQLEVGGFEYPIELRDALSSLDLLALATSPAPRVEIVHATERPTDRNLLSHLRDLGTAVYESNVSGLSQWLDASSEVAVAPQELLALLQDQLHGYSMVESNDAVTFDTALGETATIETSGKTIRERCFHLGEPALSAVIAEPTEANVTDQVAVLLLNSGVERNVGPGRAWVDWSRSLAGSGHSVMRLDLSGVGNSGTWPGKPPFHTYGPETFDDVALGIESLRSMGHRKIVIMGLCASAFSALGAAVHPNVVGIVSMSPQLYRCGTPASVAELEDTNLSRHRMSQIDKKLNLRRKGAVVGELFGRRHESTSWIDGWISQGTQVRLVFGPDDRGLAFLKWRTPNSLKRFAKTGKFTLQIQEGLDHAMHSCAPRAAVFHDICEFLKTL